jgi:hypothetical protein
MVQEIVKKEAVGNPLQAGKIMKAKKELEEEHKQEEEANEVAAKKTLKVMMLLLAPEKITGVFLPGGGRE